METKTKRRTIAEFIAAEKITATVKRVDFDEKQDGRSWADDQGARHFSVTLRATAGRRMTVRFHQGSAHTKNPTAADVLDCLASDVSSYENARSFEEWCGEFGFDIDSRRAEKTYQTIGRQREKLMSLLGASFNDLLWNTERA